MNEPLKASILPNEDHFNTALAEILPPDTTVLLTNSAGLAQITDTALKLGVDPKSITLLQLQSFLNQ